MPLPRVVTSAASARCTCAVSSQLFAQSAPAYVHSQRCSTRSEMDKLYNTGHQTQKLVGLLGLWYILGMPCIPYMIV
jgi:hypothetical protein